MYANSLGEALIRFVYITRKLNQQILMFKEDVNQDKTCIDKAKSVSLIIRVNLILESSCIENHYLEHCGEDDNLAPDTCQRVMIQENIVRVSPSIFR